MAQQEAPPAQDCGGDGEYCDGLVYRYTPGHCAGASLYKCPTCGETALKCKGCGKMLPDGGLDQLGDDNDDQCWNCDAVFCGDCHQYDKRCTRLDGEVHNNELKCDDCPAPYTEAKCDDRPVPPTGATAAATKSARRAREEEEEEEEDGEHGASLWVAAWKDPSDHNATSYSFNALKRHLKEHCPGSPFEDLEEKDAKDAYNLVFPPSYGRSRPLHIMVRRLWHDIDETEATDDRRAKKSRKTGP